MTLIFKLLPKYCDPAVGYRHLLFGIVCIFITSAGGWANTAESDQDVSPEANAILSSGTIIGVNRSDAATAFKVWLEALGRVSDLKISDSIIIATSIDQIEEQMKRSKNNMISMTIPEYSRFSDDLFEDEIILGGSFSMVGVYFVLLVHQDSGIYSLSDLKGKRLIRHEDTMTNTSDAWLHYLLADAQQAPASEFFSEYYQERDLARSVLPVYFGKSAACIVSEAGFSVMGELNPQIRQNLRVLARSKKSMPIVMVMQSGFDKELKSNVISSMKLLHEKPEGKQVLTMFKEDHIDVHDKGILEEAVQTYLHWKEVAGLE